MNLVLCILIVIQTFYLRDLIDLNNKRSQKESKSIIEIGNKLKNFDLENKTVIFCGKYDLGNEIEDPITIKKDSLAEKVEDTVRGFTGHEEKPKYVEFVLSNVECVINWGLTSFNGQSMLKNYFKYFGYNIEVLEDWDNKDRISEEKLIETYTKIAEKNKMNPLDVKEFNDYILVYFGEIYPE